MDGFPNGNFTDVRHWQWKAILLFRLSWTVGWKVFRTSTSTWHIKECISLPLLRVRITWCVRIMMTIWQRDMCRWKANMIILFHMPWNIMWQIMRCLLWLKNWERKKMPSCSANVPWVIRIISAKSLVLFVPLRRKAGFMNRSIPKKEQTLHPVPVSMKEMHGITHSLFLMILKGWQNWWAVTRSL